MKAVIFGAGGQDGYYLAKSCQNQDIEVLPISRSISRSRNISYGDVSNYEYVEQIIKYHQPEYVFHLAANSTTHHEALFDNHASIATGTLNILESIYKYSPQTKVFIAGSGLQFENMGKPISEQTPFAATSPYAISRIQSVYAARYYRSLGLSVYIGYLFHHESPLRKSSHVSQKIIQAVKNIALGRQHILELGDISVRKEWTFAGDIVNGILTVIKQNNTFEVIIGSGIAYSIQNWLEECFELIEKDWHDYVILKKDFISEYKCLLSDPKVLKSMNWKPTISLSSLAKIMLEYHD